jgi:DNA (cytosine-5)-methyltransferase 1
VAYGLRNDAGRDGQAKTPSVDAEGRSRLRDAGFNPLQELSPTLDAAAPHTVAYAIQEGAQRPNPAHGPDGIGVQEGVAYTLEARQKVQSVSFALRGREGGAMPEVGDGAVSALRSASGGSSRDFVAFSLTPASGKDGGISALELDVANTLTGVSEAAKNGRGLHLLRQAAVRRLMPVECERLQGFPDGYTRIAWRGKAAEQCPDGPRYKGLGNSMAVPCMAWIGRRIAAVEAIQQAHEAAA